MRAVTYEKRIIKDMKAVRTYKDEFMQTIKVLAKIYEEFDKAKEQFDQSGGQYIITYTNKSGVTNTVKNPLYRIIEEMEEKILAYNRELGLTPSGYKKIMNKFEKEKRSELAEALKSLGS